MIIYQKFHIFVVYVQCDLYNVLLYVQMYEAPLGRGGGGTVSLHPCPKWAVAIKRVISKL